MDSWDDTVASPGAFSHRGDARFVVRDVLGRGASSIVYRVSDARQHREVALKALPPRRVGAPASPEAEYFLRREFRARQGIQHPNLVTFYELFVEGDHSFFTMELIEGVTFREYARDGARDDDPVWRRTARAGLQLVLGVDALHVGGLLHRDLKPSNVKVTERGRVVVLDFGLAMRLDPRRALADDETIAGSLAYLAPEVLLGEAPTSASDWWSVGAMLFESLTGQLLRREGMALLEGDAYLPTPCDVDPTVPAGLSNLVAEMIAFDPARRPNSASLVHALRELAEVPGHAAASRPKAPFVGREPELHRLREAVTAADASPQRLVVTVRGPSGIGKSAFVHRFVELMDGTPGALCLVGTCHDHESVPFKALDGVIDALSRVLRQEDDAEVRALRPRWVSALVRQFPVLASTALGVDLVDDTPADAQEALRRATIALCDLLDAIAASRRLLIWIDDLQWGDHDSVPVLRELLQRRAACTLILSWRLEDEDAAEALLSLRDALASPDLARLDITLSGLAPQETACIARALLGPDAPDSLADAVAAGCDGSPLLAQTFAAHLGADEVALGIVQRRDVRAAFARRLGSLSTHARELLDVVAVAGGPVASDDAVAACDNADAARLALDVMPAGLLRVTLRDGVARLAFDHDQVRQITLSALDTAARRARCRRLAEVLAAREDADPNALVDLYVQSGDALPAARYATRAAQRAFDAMAFELAARLYRVALAQRSVGTGSVGLDEWTLEERLGDSLVNAGRGAEAAGRYLRAARALERACGDRLEVVRYERLAAAQSLRNGQLAEGFEGARRVLAAFGETLPSGDGEALRESLLRRATFLVRSTTRAPARKPPRREELARLDAVWTLSTALGFVRPMLADALAMRHMQRALALGDRSRLCRAYAMEASFEASFGGALFRARAERLADLAGALARETGSPYDHAWSRFAAGIVAYVNVRWREAMALHEEALDTFRRRCRGASWEIVMAEAFVVTSAAYLGELGLVRERLTAAIADVEARGDRFGSIHLKLGQPTVAWIARDEPDRVLADVDAAIAGWPSGGFLTQHYLHLVSSTQALLYKGDGARAWARVEDAWPRVVAAGWERLECSRAELHHLRGCAAIAAAAADAGSRRRALEREIERSIAAVEGTALRWSAPFAASLRAGLAALQGDVPRVTASLERAATGFLAAEMRLHAECAAYLRGGFGDGLGPRARRAEAEEWLRRASVKKPARMAATFFPGVV